MEHRLDICLTTPPAPLRPPNIQSLNSTKSTRNEVIGLPMRHKVKWLNTTLKFFKDDTLTLEYPEMPKTEAEYFCNVIYDQNNKNIGFGFKSLYAPLLEAMEVMKTKYELKATFSKTSDTSTVLLLEKIPLNTIKKEVKVQINGVTIRENQEEYTKNPAVPTLFGNKFSVPTVGSLNSDAPYVPSEKSVISTASAIKPVIPTASTMKPVFTTMSTAKAIVPTAPDMKSFASRRTEKSSALSEPAVKTATPIVASVLPVSPELFAMKPIVSTANATLKTASIDSVTKLSGSTVPITKTDVSTLPVVKSAVSMAPAVKSAVSTLPAAKSVVSTMPVGKSAVSMASAENSAVSLAPTVKSAVSVAPTVKSAVLCVPVTISPISKNVVTIKSASTNNCNSTISSLNRSITNSVKTLNNRENAKDNNIGQTKKERCGSKERSNHIMKIKLTEGMSTPLESDKGKRMMQLMGWMGGALGVRGEGLTEPIKPDLDISNRAGLGHIPESQPDPAKTIIINKFLFRVVLLENILKLIQSSDILRNMIFDNPTSTNARKTIKPITDSLNLRKKIRLDSDDENYIVDKILFEMFEDPALNLVIRVVSKTKITITKTWIKSNNKPSTNQIEKATKPSLINITLKSECKKNKSLKNSTPIYSQNVATKREVKDSPVVIKNNNQEPLIYDAITLEDIELYKVYNNDGQYGSDKRIEEVALRMILLQKILSFYEIDHKMWEITFIEVQFSSKYVEFLDGVVSCVNKNKTWTSSCKSEIKVFSRILDTAEEDGHRLDIKYHSSLTKIRLIKCIDSTDLHPNDLSFKLNQNKILKDRTRDDIVLTNDNFDQDCKARRYKKDMSEQIIDKTENTNNDVNNTAVTACRKICQVNYNGSSNSNPLDLRVKLNQNEDKRTNGDIYEERNNTKPSYNNKEHVNEVENVNIEENDTDRNISSPSFNATNESRNFQDVNTNVNNSDSSKVPLEIFIVPKKYPMDVINDNLVVKVQKAIVRHIDESDCRPLLKCHGVKNGTLVYSCHNEQSLIWLQNIINCDNDLKVVNSNDDILKTSIYYKVSIKINTFIKESVRVILNRIQSYNPDLAVNNWKLYDTEHFNDHILIKCEIDGESLKYLSNSKFSLYAGVDEAIFNVISK